MADLLDHAAERSASKAVTAIIKWNILHDAKHPVDGSQALLGENNMCWFIIFGAI